MLLCFPSLPVSLLIPALRGQYQKFGKKMHRQLIYSNIVYFFLQKWTFFAFSSRAHFLFFYFAFIFHTRNKLYKRWTLSCIEYPRRAAKGAWFQTRSSLRALCSRWTSTRPHYWTEGVSQPQAQQTMLCAQQALLKAKEKFKPRVRLETKHPHCPDLVPSHL